MTGFASQLALFFNLKLDRHLACCDRIVFIFRVIGFGIDLHHTFDIIDLRQFFYGCETEIFEESIGGPV